MYTSFLTRRRLVGKVTMQMPRYQIHHYKHQIHHHKHQIHHHEHIKFCTITFLCFCYKVILLVFFSWLASSCSPVAKASNTKCWTPIITINIITIESTHMMTPTQTMQLYIFIYVDSKPTSYNNY